MLRSVHMKLVMIMVLLILSLMTVVGTFLINSVMAFYLEEFYTQMSRVFDQNQALSRNLETEVTSDEDGAQAILSIMEAYYGDLGLDSRSRTLYILDGETGDYLTGTDEEEGRGLEYDSPNLTRALVEREEGTEANIAADYMDVALPITRGDNQYVIYILDNKATVNSLISQIFGLILESLVFGLIISILLSFLLSKTMIIPIQRLTEGAMRVAEGDFSRRIEVTSRDEIGVLTDTFNDMARQLRDTLRQVENERNKLDTLFLHMTDGVVAFDHTGKLIHCNPAAKTMLQRAGEAFADERPDDAIRYLDELGDAPEPYLTMAQRLRTVCLFAKGDLDRVISVCEEIEKKSPDADNKVTLAAAYCFQGRYDDVDRVLDEVLAADDIPEYVTLKLLHLLVERQRDADILQITEKLSRHARLWHASEMFRSEALYNLGKRQEAVRVMKRVDNVFGEFSAAHYYLGIYEGEPEKVPYGCEMPQECQLAIVRGIKQITDGGDVTRLQRALTYDAAFNRDLRWVIDNCADIIACPVLMYLSDIRSRAVEKIFRDRLIGVRLSFDQMTLIIDYLVGGGLSVQFDIVAQGRFKNVDFRLPACFRALPKKFKSAVYRTACDIVFTDEDPTYYLDRLCAIVEDLVTADAHGEPVWKRRSGRKIAKLRSEVTMIGVLLSEVYRDDPDPDEDAMERYELSPRTFYKYRAIFFGDDDARVRDDGGEEEDDED